MNQHWQDRVVFAIGLWLIVSNWLIGFNHPDDDAAATSVVYWNFVAFAALAIGYAALMSFRLWKEFANIALGAWLFASPWLLDFAIMTIAAWSAVACGALIVLSATWSLYEER